MGYLDLMSAAREFGDYWLGVRAFDLEYPARMGETTGSFRGLLRIHPGIEYTMQKMSVTGRLVMSPYHPKRHDRISVFAQHAGNDGVQRPLPWRNRVWMAIDKLKA